jgi:surface antigen
MEHALLAFSLLSAPIDTTRFNNPLIEPEPIAVVTETIKELTVEEKIASNYYKCDEATQYIRADDATCIARPTYRASESRSTAKSTKTPTTTQNTATAPSGWYPRYSCTGHVASKRSVGQWNDASDWLWQAQRDGWATGSTPAVGAIGWQPGHVVYIEAIEGDQVYISERNYDNNGSYREIWKPASQYKYIY